MYLFRIFCHLLSFLFNMKYEKIENEKIKKY